MDDQTNEMEQIDEIDEIDDEPSEKTSEIVEPIGKGKKPRPICKLCGASFANRQTLQSHYSKGICLGKGYMCLRCFKVKRTPHELQRHQGAEKKCKPSSSASVTRDENGNVNIVIER